MRSAATVAVAPVVVPVVPAAAAVVLSYNRFSAFKLLLFWPHNGPLLCAADHFLYDPSSVGPLLCAAHGTLLCAAPNGPLLCAALLLRPDPRPRRRARNSGAGAPRGTGVAGRAASSRATSWRQ